ncbi:uncharacterized protein LOC142233907 [Haematobia irritans]|uniref:uncharacterized protein LOC142233907 n=1 Tax=Haematobia irritans TaxID=7368 RepID=UPI003F5037AC
MMETITLAANNTTQGLDGHHHHRNSTEEDDQIMNLSDMAELSPQLPDEDIVALPKEVILITLVSQEQSLYNPKHENYRNTHRKDMMWMDIAKNVGWTEMQCKAKWKAMRDQYCRELKRSKLNAKVTVKWKYFKELEFLRPYALARNYRPRNPTPSNSNINGNNQNTFNCSAVPSASEINNTSKSNTTFTTIKIESNVNEGFVTSDGTTNNLTEEQLNTVLQQQTHDNNWAYITGSSTSSSNHNNSRLDSHSLAGDTGTQHPLLSTTHHHHHQQQQQHADEALYNALVDCVGQIQQQQQHQLCHQQLSNSSHHQTSSTNDEEDDDPIHTFLNIESYFEKELIALIQHEDVLYNSFHPNYRNVKLKLEVWDEIARKLKKTVKQCRLKWKALRDQFIREHKRLKNRDNIESLPRWKHYDALSFLQKFIKHKVGEFEAKSLTQQIPKTEIDIDIDDEDDHMNINGNSALRSSLENIKREINQNQLEIPALVTSENNQNVHQHSQSLCVPTGNVGEFDDMDIDHYMIGDEDSVEDRQNSTGEQDNEMDDEHKSHQNFSIYTNQTNRDDVGARRSIMDSTNQSFKTSSSSPQHPTTTCADSENRNQHTHHINMPSLDLNDSPNLIRPDNLKISTEQPTVDYATLPSGSNGSVTSALDTLTATSTSTRAPSNTPSLVPTTCEASTNTQPAVQILQPSNNSVLSEDDEVGAFFKAVAMKIRNAKLSPVAFTDLQIDILKVINGSLRNH